MLKQMNSTASKTSGNRVWQVSCDFKKCLSLVPKSWLTWHWSLRTFTSGICLEFWPFLKMHRMNMKLPYSRSKCLERVKSGFHFPTSLNFSLWKKWSFKELSKRRLLFIQNGCRKTDWEWRVTVQFERLILLCVYIYMFWNTVTIFFRV